MMDWDIEAPGLDRYFRKYSDLANRGGLIHLLSDASIHRKNEWEPFIQSIVIDGHASLSMLTSGDNGQHYSDLMQDFSWPRFFKAKKGGKILDRWRNEGKAKFDFILIDSRTGLTDVGGAFVLYFCLTS